MTSIPTHEALTTSGGRRGGPAAGVAEGQARGVVAVAAGRGVALLCGAVLLAATGCLLEARPWLMAELGGMQLMAHYAFSAAALAVTGGGATLLTPDVAAVVAMYAATRPCDKVRLQPVVLMASAVHWASLAAAAAALAWTPPTLALGPGLQELYAHHLERYADWDDSRRLLDGLHRAARCCGLFHHRHNMTVPWSCCSGRHRPCRTARRGGLHPDDAFPAACDAILARRGHSLHALLDAAALLAAALALLHRLAVLHFFSAVPAAPPPRPHYIRLGRKIQRLIFR